tara:strand:+ start:87825 stop:88070 length:246 start_codon:yes stop_codon:yes gene_type:complete
MFEFIKKFFSGFKGSFEDRLKAIDTKVYKLNEERRSLRFEMKEASYRERKNLKIRIASLSNKISDLELDRQIVMEEYRDAA